MEADVDDHVCPAIDEDDPTKPSIREWLLCIADLVFSGPVVGSINILTLSFEAIAIVLTGPVQSKFSSQKVDRLWTAQSIKFSVKA